MKTAFIFICLAVLAIGLIIGLLRLLFPLPPLADRIASSAIPPSAETLLGKAILALDDRHAGKTGVFPLQTGIEAFASRVVLARAAAKTIDAQYYIWHKDTSGLLLLKELHDAAERGVRVRLLVDDSGTRGLDPELAAFESHPNIEVRLFNPLTIRNPLAAGYVIAPIRANRRMHNKSFTVDNVATIIGGRNIGDEYFGAGDGTMFADLDVLAVGAITPAVSADFDRYWSSRSSFPVSAILKLDPQARRDVPASVTDIATTAAAKSYLEEVIKTPLIARLGQGTLAIEWTDVKLVSDDPAKGLGEASPEQLMISKLFAITGKPERTLDLISAYFVPGARGAEILGNAARRGVNVRILTNAQDTTDVLPVHAGYSKYRPDLLEAGVRLFELKPLTNRSREERGLGLTGSSGASLHAKTFAIDGERIFIGSFNFDPRSALLNCEMGLLIESPALAGQMLTFFDKQAAAISYEVSLDGRALRWTEKTAGGPKVHETEPGMTFMTRAAIKIIGWLPVEWML